MTNPPNLPISSANCRYRPRCIASSQQHRDAVPSIATVHEVTVESIQYCIPRVVRNVADLISGSKHTGYLPSCTCSMLPCTRCGVVTLCRGRSEHYLGKYRHGHRLATPRTMAVKNEKLLRHEVYSPLAENTRYSRCSRT